MSVTVLPHVSEALRGNRLGDPHERTLHVVVPDDLGDDDMVPCVWYLAGYASVGRAMLSNDPWQEGLEERLVRLRREGLIGKMLVALPDAFTRLGGCQYLSSPVVGDYEAYLLVELRRLVEERWPVCAHAVVGKSSGGHAALVHAMRRPGSFRAVACHSGDMAFHLSLLPEIPHLMDSLGRYGSVEALLEAFVSDPEKKSGRWFQSLYVLAMASVFSPDEHCPLGFRLPFDLMNACFDDEVLRRWMAYDPLTMIDHSEHQRALLGLDELYLDCGSRDQHFLHLGAAALHRKLVACGVDHTFELFDGGHRGTTHRLDVSLPRIHRALSPKASAGP